MKKILLIALAFSLAGNIFSQQTPDKDPKAKAILDKLSKKHKAIDNIVIDFKAHIHGAKIKSQKMNGKAYKSGKKFAYKTSEFDVVNNGVTNWMYVKKDNEVTITSNEDEDEETGLISPAKLLTIWEKGFKYKFNGEKTVDGIKVQEIKLYPTNPKKSQYHQIALYVNKAKNELSRVIIKGRDGVNMDYLITKFQSGAKISPKTFVFDKSKYPGCKENDMRF